MFFPLLRPESIRFKWLCALAGIAGFLALVLVWASSPIRNQKLLIQSIETKRFFELLGTPQYRIYSLESAGVAYIAINSIFKVNDARIGVYASAPLAKKYFDHSSSNRAVSATRVKGKVPGDQFACWVGPRFGAQGLSKPLDYSMNWVLRRRNVVLHCSYSGFPTKAGLLQKAVADATRIDAELLTSTLFAPRGNKILTPEIEMRASKMADSPDILAIEVNSADKTPFIIGKADRYQVVSGIVVYRKPKPWKGGQKKVEIEMATEGNVVFTKSLILKTSELTWEQKRGE
jgi:hypothetical protein